MARRGLGGYAAVRVGVKRELLESSLVQRAREALALPDGDAIEQAVKRGRVEACLEMLIERIEAL